MDIIPPFVLNLDRLYLEPLGEWFSKRLYELLILKQEFLVEVAALVDFGPLE